jgi:hypothetical protein
MSTGALIIAEKLESTNVLSFIIALLSPEGERKSLYAGIEEFDLKSAVSY